MRHYVVYILIHASNEKCKTSGKELFSISKFPQLDNSFYNEISYRL